MKTRRPCVAEFVGTLYLCFAGIGAIVCNTPAVAGVSGLLGNALARGVALSITVNVFGGESSAHFNPAVTSGFLVAGRIAPASPAHTCSHSCSAQPGFMASSTTRSSRAESRQTVDPSAACGTPESVARGG